MLEITEKLLLFFASVGILTLLLIAISNTKSYGQKAEVGVIAGASNYLGEIGGDSKPGQPFVSDIQYNMTNFATGAFYRYEMSHTVAYRFNFIYSRISGDDKYSSNYARNLRNLNFRSDIFEISLQTELMLLRKSFSIHANPFKGTKKTANYIVRGEIGVYAFAGIGVFHFNPQTKYNGEWINLQPLCTEGQGISTDEIQIDGEKYQLTQMNLPVGAGLYYRFNQYKIGLEIGWRYTFTDYLDDVSKNYIDPKIIENYNGKTAAELSNRADEITSDSKDLIYTAAGQKRGNPENKDSYIFSMVSFSMLLNSNNKTYFRK